MYGLLDVDDGSIKILRSVTFAEHSASKVLEKKINVIVDIIEDEEETDAPYEEEVMKAPPMRTRQER